MSLPQGWSWPLELGFWNKKHKKHVEHWCLAMACEFKIILSWNWSGFFKFLDWNDDVYCESNFSWTSARKLCRSYTFCRLKVVESLNLSTSGSSSFKRSDSPSCDHICHGQNLVNFPKKWGHQSISIAIDVPILFQDSQDRMNDRGPLNATCPWPWHGQVALRKRRAKQLETAPRQKRSHWNSMSQGVKVWKVHNLWYLWH